MATTCGRRGRDVALAVEEDEGVECAWGGGGVEEEEGLDRDTRLSTALAPIDARP